MSTKTGLDALLIFPPGWTPFSPYLALPLLSAQAQAKGHEVAWQDSNLQFFDSILTREFIQKRSDVLRAEIAELETQGERTSRYTKLIAAYARRGVADAIDWAKQTIRTMQYLEPATREKVDSIIARALHLVSVSYPGSEITFNQIKLQYRSTSTQEILAATEDSARNPYLEFYRTHTLPLIEKTNPRFVGISITGASQLIAAVTLAKCIREMSSRNAGASGAPSGARPQIIVGGNFITRITEDWDESHPLMEIFDYVVRGDGEMAFLELLSAKAAECDIAGVLSSRANRANKGWGKRQKRTQSTHLAELVCPHFESLNEESYLIPTPVYPLFASRSCHGRCAFCTIANGTNGKYRTMPADKIYAWMDELSKRSGARYFSFVDETLPIAEMSKVALRIRAASQPWVWYGETRFSPALTQEVLHELYAGGCRKIQFGLESYNQRVLDLMQKQTKEKWIDQNVQSCLEAGIAVHLFFMVGFPGETEGEALRTIHYAEGVLRDSRNKYKNPNSTIGWGSFGLDKGSAVWNQSERFGIEILPAGANEDLKVQWDYTPIVGTIGMSHEQIQRLVATLNENPLAKLERSGHVFGNDLKYAFRSEEMGLLAGEGMAGTGAAVCVAAALEAQRFPEPRAQDLWTETSVTLGWKESLCVGGLSGQQLPCDVIRFNCLTGEFVLNETARAKVLPFTGGGSPLFSAYNVMAPAANGKVLIFNTRSQRGMFVNSKGLKILKQEEQGSGAAVEALYATAQRIGVLESST